MRMEERNGTTKDSTADFEDDYVRRIQETVRNVKASREMEARYMLLEEWIKDEREQARAEVLSETVLELLEEIGEVPEELQRRIMEESRLNILKSYIKKASAANSVEEKNPPEAHGSDFCAFPGECLFCVYPNNAESLENSFPLAFSN